MVQVALGPDAAGERVREGMFLLMLDHQPVSLAAESGVARAGFVNHLTNLHLMDAFTGAWMDLLTNWACVGSVLDTR